MRALHAVCLAALAVTSLAAPAVGSTATPPPTEQRLENDSVYYQGTTLTRADYAPPNVSEAAIHSAVSGSQIRNTSLQDGDLRITGTAEMDGEYYVTAPGAPRLDFEVVPEGLAMTASPLRVAEDPLRPVVTVEVNASRYDDGTYHVTSEIPDLAARASGHHVTVLDDDTIAIDDQDSFTLNLSGLDAGEYTLHAQNPNTAAAATHTVVLNETVIPPAASSYERVERGGTYWRPATLAVDTGQSGVVYRVESVAGDRVATQLSSTGGVVHLSTAGWPAGVYRVVDENFSEVSRFELRVQSLSADVSDGVLTLESNRGGFDAVVEVENGSESVTERVLAHASGDETTLTDLGARASIALNTSALAAGDYSVSVAAVGSEASANASFSVSTPQTTTTTTSTATSTTASTTTPTSTDTATPTSSTAPTTTPTSPGGSAGGVVPGFTASTAVLAFAGAALLGLARRD